MTTQRLKPIIDRICKRAGIPPGSVNSAALRKIDLQGFAITGDTTGQAAIEQLMGLFQFYCVPSDGQLKFVPIAESPSAGVIHSDHIGTMQNSDDGGAVIRTARESSLPRKVELAFSDPAMGYRENVAAAYRLTADTENTVRLSAPLVVPYDRAEQICHASLTAAWASQCTTEIQVPLEYAHIEAGDTVEFDDALWIVSKVQYNAPLAFRLSLEKFSYAPFKAVTAPAVAPVIVPAIQQKAQPVPIMLDVQLLNADTDSSGFYFGAYCPKGLKSARYATLAIKDIDGEYEAKGTVAVGLVAGQLETALAPGLIGTLDTTTQLQVALLSEGALYSCTFDEAVAGKNRVLVGNELMAYTTADLDSQTGNYTLSGLIRGLGGTSPGAAAGERFVLMTKQLLASVALDTGETGKANTYKLFGLDIAESTATEFSFVNTNQRLRPLPPVLLRCEREYTSYQLSWLRQARKNYAWINECDVPLDFNRERYEVQILDAAGAPMGSAYTVDTPQLSVAIVAGAHAFKVRQLGDLLPGAWSEPTELN